MEKYHYLKAILIGEAAKYIEALQLSEENYDIILAMHIDRSFRNN